MLSATWMSQVDMSSMALPWHWPAISHTAHLEKTHHLLSWIFLRANIFNSPLVMPSCPTLMNMLVTSSYRPYFIPKVAQSCCRVIWRIVAPICASSRRIKCNRTERNIYRLLWALLSHTATRRYLTRINGWEFSIFNEKSTIDGNAEIGHAHHHESSGVCKSWPDFTDFWLLSPPCIEEEMSMEEAWWSVNQRWCTSWNSFGLR